MKILGVLFPGFTALDLIGPTTVWAAMQACGVVNDHLATCWVRDVVEGLRHP